MNMQSEQVNELFAALAKAQAEIKPAQKDSTNPFHKSKYADLSSVMDACKDALSKNSLAVTQSVDSMNGQFVLITTLGHSSGQWIKSMCPLLTAKGDSQSFGASLTYMRRFSLAAMVGVCPEDDDGERERKIIEKQERTHIRPGAKQVIELRNLLKNCSKEFNDSVNKCLLKKGYKSIAEMSIEEFELLSQNAQAAMSEVIDEDGVIYESN